LVDGKEEEKEEEEDCCGELPARRQAQEELLVAPLVPRILRQMVRLEPTGKGRKS